jgi:hypothetical protein
MATPMNSKQQVRKILEQFPDNCSLEDIQYQIYVIQKLRSRSKSADAGAFVSQNEAEKRMARWIR